MALIECSSLPLKLRHFFESAGRAATPPFPLKDKAALAAWFEINRARISAWTRGDESKNRDPNMVQEHHVQALAGLYAQLAPGPISIEEAVRCWVTASAEQFRDGLVGRRELRSLHQLLAERPPMLDLALEPHRDSLGMIDDMAEPMEGACRVALRERFCLHLRKKRGKSFYLLVEAPEGLYLHVPGRTHDGRFLHCPERLPPGRGWWNFATAGAHRLIVIEMGCDLPPWVRDPGSGANPPLGAEEIEALVEAVIDTARVRHWEWGMLDVHVDGDRRPPTAPATPTGQ